MQRCSTLRSFYELLLQLYRTWNKVKPPAVYDAKMLPFLKIFESGQRKGELGHLFVFSTYF